MWDLDDEELKLVIKSLSITYDATSKKLDRLKGRHYDEAVAEAGVCDRVLNRAKAEQAKRWQNHGQRVWPIGVTPPTDKETRT